MGMQKITHQDVIKVFDAFKLKDEGQRYLTLHCKRIAYAMNSIREYQKERNPARVLDIGPHYLTRCIEEFFPDIVIGTLGWKMKGPVLKSSPFCEHIQFDLNECGPKEITSLRAPYDLIVFSETIEHLYTSPLLVLPELKKLLSPYGSILIQTPNAASLKSRWKLLMGRHPYEQIRIERSNPGHFREYTLGELVWYAEATGFRVRRAEYCNYWEQAHPVARWIENSVPPLRQGISMLIENCPVIEQPESNAQER